MLYCQSACQVPGDSMCLSVDEALRVRMEQRNMSHKSKLGPSQEESCRYMKEEVWTFS